MSWKETKKVKKKLLEDNIIKYARNHFKLKKENEAIKDRIIRDIRNVFEQEKDYHKPVRVGAFFRNNYVNYKGNRNKTRPYQSKNSLKNKNLKIISIISKVLYMENSINNNN